MVRGLPLPADPVPAPIPDLRAEGVRAAEEKDVHPRTAAPPHRHRGQDLLHLGHDDVIPEQGRGSDRGEVC